MKRVSLVVFISLMMAAAAFAQAPGAPAASAAAAPEVRTAASAGAGPSRIGVIDFNRAVVESADGKKAAEAIKGEMSKLEADFTKAQGELEALQKQAQSQGNVLSDTAKAELSTKIDRKNTELTRINEDAQKQMGELQERHFGPIAQVISKEVSAYAAEQGLAVVLDGSMQPSNIIFANDIADITTEIIRRVNANPSKASSAPATTAPRAPAGAPGASRPAPATTTPKPPTPAAPK